VACRPRLGDRVWPRCSHGQECAAAREASLRRAGRAVDTYLLACRLLQGARTSSHVLPSAPIACVTRSRTAARRRRPRGHSMPRDAHHERLSSLDATFLGVEDRGSHMHIGSVGVFEGSPGGAVDLERVHHLVSVALDGVPRYRQRSRRCRSSAIRCGWTTPPSIPTTISGTRASPCPATSVSSSGSPAA
jgi:hypothetical protein